MPALASDERFFIGGGPMEPSIRLEALDVAEIPFTRMLLPSAGIFLAEDAGVSGLMRLWSLPTALPASDAADGGREVVGVLKIKESRR